MEGVPLLAPKSHYTTGLNRLVRKMWETGNTTIKLYIICCITSFATFMFIHIRILWAFSYKTKLYKKLHTLIVWRECVALSVVNIVF